MTAAPSTLPFQFSIVPDKPQIRANETKDNPNVTLTLILTLTLITILTPLNPIVATWSVYSRLILSVLGVIRPIYRVRTCLSITIPLPAWCFAGIIGGNVCTFLLHKDAVQSASA